MEKLKEYLTNKKPDPIARLKNHLEKSHSSKPPKIRSVKYKRLGGTRAYPYKNQRYKKNNSKKRSIQI